MYHFSIKSPIDASDVVIRGRAVVGVGCARVSEAKQGWLSEECEIDGWCSGAARRLTMDLRGLRLCVRCEELKLFEFQT